MANNAVVKVTATWLDFEGESTTCAFYASVDDQQKMGDLFTWARDKAASIEPLSNANLSRVTMSIEEFYTALVPSQLEGEPYSNAEDKLIILMDNEKGKASRINIPAPKSACFKTDGETWYPGVTPLDTFYANFLASDSGDGGTGAEVSDPDGIHILQMHDGYRRRVKTKKERGGRATAIG